MNPLRPSDYGTIYVYASPNGNFSSAVKIGETDGTQFIHDASNSADSVSAGDVRYYWVRAVKNVGTDAASQSNLEPNADPNTTVFATVGRVNWSDVSGSTNAPADNATVGAQISVNLYDTDGSTVMNQSDVKNSILAQEILQVEVESGEVLDLETGQDVDIQNLGDVAIFVSDSNQTLNSSINTVAQNLSSLEDAVIDITSGVSDIYIQGTQPVAGVGGIPDPIPTFSRWYDSSNNNAPYYWDGSAWQDFRDGQIALNQTAITNLQTSLATTNGNVTSNASAISVLDATTVSQGNSITSITSDVTALETTVNNATTGVAANASGLSNLTTRVTTAEGSITTNASDITTLNTNVTTANTNITTNATAISGLDTRVTTAEGTITTQSSDITALESTVNNGTTGVAANASGLSALTTRVTTAEGAITTNSSAVTTLDATYTEDLHFRTEVEDENDDLIDLETSGTVQLQDLSDFVSGSSSAIDSLTVQTYVNEDDIQTQAIQLTALESTVNDPTNGVVATAGALSNLTTEVSVIDGVVTSTAQDLTTLTTTVGGNTASITTQAESINGVEANYSVKIDNNNRITGFGLLSTTSGSTPFSEFAVVADQFSIVDPASTADTPLQPFTVTSAKIFLNTDVQVDGNLLTTGTTISDVSLVVGSGTSFFRASSDGLQLGNETFASAPFRVTSEGALTATSATISGTVNASAGAFTGDVSTDSKFVAGSGATSATMDGADANYKFYAGAADAGDSPFKVDASGVVTADRIVITRPDDPSAVIFDSAQDGLVGVGLSSLSSGTDNAVAQVADELTSDTDYARLILSTTQTLTIKVLFPLGYAPFAVSSAEDFPDSITLTLQIASIINGTVGTFSDVSGGSKTFTRRIYNASDASDDDYYSVNDSGTGWYIKDKDGIDSQFNLVMTDSGVYTSGDIAIRVQVSYVAGSGATNANPSSSSKRTLYFNSATQYFTIDSSNVIRDQSAGSILTGDVVLSGASGARTISWRDSDTQDENWSIEGLTGYGESGSGILFFKFNNGTTNPISFVDNGNILITGDFYTGVGAITSATASFGGGYGSTGVSIDSSGNYQGNGNIDIDGTVTQGSDIRLKSDVETIDGSKVFGMRGVSFVKNGEKGAGVIAQELQEIAPELVKEGSDGMLSVAYGDLIGYLIESVKTLKYEIEQIKADQS